MEQPPLIDVEPEDNGNSRGGCMGCFGRSIPFVVGFLLLLIILMVVAFFVWGSGLEGLQKGAEGAEGAKQEEKTGIAGMVEKVKRTVKGEKTTPAEGEPDGDAVQKGSELAHSIEGEEKSLEERNRLLKEKFGHLEENGSKDSAGGPGQGGEVAEVFEKREPRGGSFGSSTGSAVAGGKQGLYQRWRGNFSTSGSDLEFEVIYQEAGGQLQFRCFVMPYDSQTAKLFRGDKGDLLLSFSDNNGQQLVPAKQALPIPLTKLTAFEAGGRVSGWVARGMVPLEGHEVTQLKAVKLGWDFDKELSDWLKDLKKSRGQ